MVSFFSLDFWGVKVLKRLAQESSSVEASRGGEAMDVHSAEYLNAIMMSQLRLSLKLSAAFVVILLGLPLANYYFPDIVNTRVFGLTATWLFLGVLFYPLTWVIARIYISKSLALEHEIAGWIRGEIRDGDRS